MGVFKWLRRERVTVTTHHISPEPSTPEEQCPQSSAQVGTIRTEEYKRDLAEFQARRSSGNKELQNTPEKKKCGRHSLPVSCTDCAADHDNTFNYEKKSAVKYKKKTHKRARSAMSDEKIYDGLPNIQFLFQNQVFMPGNVVATSTYSEPHKSRRNFRHRYFRPPDPEFLTQRHIDFKDEDRVDSPEFCKKSSLPFNVKNFLDGSKSGEEEVDGYKEAGDVTKLSSQVSSNGVHKNECGDEKLWEVMTELKNFDQWADDQLQPRSPNTTKSEDSKSDSSAYGLPIASASNLDVTSDRSKVWNHGKWGVVPVQIKRMPGVTIEHVRKKRNTEINILRKCRHPNIILLMGVYPDVRNDVHLVCERCVDTLYGILHVQGRILTAQTAVRYALDVANALVFLRMQGFVHSALTSESIMVTGHDAAKLADLGPCLRLPKNHQRTEKGYDVYSSEPQYASIEETFQSNNAECEPLLSARSSEAYITTRAVPKDYQACRNSEYFRWQAPELFQPDEEGLVHVCSRSDVYSLALILWECCNASLPWKTLSYDKLKELYVLWKAGVLLPQDGTYPGCLLALLQAALKLDRMERMDLDLMQDTLSDVKRNIDDLEYIVIPARLPKKKSDFSSVAWDTTSPTDSECLSPQNIQHKVVVHKERDTSTDSSEKDCSKSESPHYERILKNDTYAVTYAVPEKCFISDEDQEKIPPKYELLPDKDFSSACSTPIAKLRARIKDIGTPGTLHRSDSTEYCSILSPNRTNHFGPSDDTFKDQTERPAAKLSRSFTPKSYKPLHIKVPDFKLDSIRDILKDQNDKERSSYNFDIKNYSLPTTPIARSNKLRKNAWLSGDLSMTRRSTETLQDSKSSNKEDKNDGSPQDCLTRQDVSTNTSWKKDDPVENNNNYKQYESKESSPHSIGTECSFSGLRISSQPQTSSPDSPSAVRERSNSWSFRTSVGGDRGSRHRIEREENAFTGVNVKPLVAIHERWIYEANKKTGRSMSLPEDNKCVIQGVKPASHCVDTLQKSLPQLYGRRPTKPFRAPASSTAPRNGTHWEQFCQARETIAKSVNFSQRDTERFHTWKKETDKSTVTEEELPKVETKVDQATDTRSIEEFIRELIRKEFQHILQEMSEDGSTSDRCSVRNDELLNRGVANIMENLKNDDGERREPVKSFSRVKINGNNKPLLQITFSRSGENSLQVLDNCVNVTICDGSRPGAPEKGDKPERGEKEDALDEGHVNSLKRCQAFSAIQEARSTEDLYIDDDLSTQLQENFGGRVKLIPLHGSLHEILCEKEDDCCLIKVKQENGCDTIYFRCDNSDTESRDALDGAEDTVVFKRSISLVEERFQRVPRDRRAHAPARASPAPLVLRRNNPELLRVRPKSEVLLQNINKESRVLSNSSPSLIMKDDKSDEVEVNIENVMSYQDSSSEECLKCQAENDDFEFLERKIEEDLANSTLSSLTCGCLEKISEENLSVINEDVMEKD